MRMRPLGKPRKLVAVERTGKGVRSYHLVATDPESVEPPKVSPALCGGRPTEDAVWGVVDPMAESNKKCCDKCFERQAPDERKRMNTLQIARFLDERPR